MDHADERDVSTGRTGAGGCYALHASGEGQQGCRRWMDPGAKRGDLAKGPPCLDTAGYNCRWSRSCCGDGTLGGSGSGSGSGYGFGFGFGCGGFGCWVRLMILGWWVLLNGPSSVRMVCSFP